MFLRSYLAGFVALSLAAISPVAAIAESGPDKASLVGQAVLYKGEFVGPGLSTTTGSRAARSPVTTSSSTTLAGPPTTGSTTTTTLAICNDGPFVPGDATNLLFPFPGGELPVDFFGDGESSAGRDSLHSERPPAPGRD